MRVSPGYLTLLALGSSLVGCSQTGGLRATNPSDVKTTASVGDKPLGIVAGLPGEEGRAQLAHADRTRSTAARISGRVFDEEGEPVRNAVVRLALTGAAGGKAVHATTDRSGAFTLRGVRPGSTYTVIAEYQGDQGVMTGRADADAPDVDVSISLHPRDGQSAEGTQTASKPEGPSVRSVARAEERFDEADEDRTERDPVPAKAARTASTRPRLDPEADDIDDTARGWSSDKAKKKPPAAREPQDDQGSMEDDGENPLPPAREISKVSTQADELPPATEADGEAPRSLPDGLIEEDDGRFGPVILDDEPAAEEPAPRKRPAAPSRPSTAVEPKVERARPTWSEVISQNGGGSVDASLAQTNAVVATGPAMPEPSPAVAEEPPPEAKPAAAATSVMKRDTPYCDYNPDDRRMIDFALYDVDGKLTSIRDFDADLILLDFWGTWCPDCLTSIPHLTEIQRRFGGKKVQVVSIAYERVKPAERSAKIKEVAKNLKMNYPILVQDMDADCPIRDALQVWFYPTMILIDREGKIIRREAGATAQTLANIDRAIATHLEGPATFARREPKGRVAR